jgi:hypothetical protein
MTEKTPEEKVSAYRAKVANLNGSMVEAGGIAFLTVYFDNNVPVNLTCRSANPYDALMSLQVGLKLAQEYLGVTLSKDLPQAAPPKATPVSDEFDKAFPKDPVYEDTEFEGLEMMTASSIKVLPQPDEKVTLEFYDGGQYPVIKVNKWKVADAQALLKHVTSQDVSKASEVGVSVKIYWEEGAEYEFRGKIGRYKNVKHLRLA